MILFNLVSTIVSNCILLKFMSLKFHPVPNDVGFTNIFSYLLEFYNDINEQQNLDKKPVNFFRNDFEVIHKLCSRQGRSKIFFKT